MHPTKAPRSLTSRIINRKLLLLGVALGLIGFHIAAAQPDILIADFEGETYGDWAVTGEAFGPGPARGTLPGQMRVDGFRGKGLVNSFYNGDGTTGTLSSPEFKIERPYITFLIGGGGYAGKTCMNLLVEGQTVRTATGPNTVSGGSERLEPASWDVSELLGKTARLQIVDDATGGWGHINVDHIVLTETKPPLLLKDARRELAAESRFLHLPVNSGAPKRNVSIAVDGRVERAFEIELADGEPDWWAFTEIEPFKGRKLTVTVDQLRDDSKGLTQIEQGDAIKGAEMLYREPLRPQFHFSARRGWLNDPNGLVHFEGEWHLFFQHNPYGWNWGNMHWGQAVSRDLVHWEERGEALYPDELGTMFSGSAVVDWKNTSGFGKDGQPAIVLIYTAAGGTGAQSRGKGFTQCIAYSNDKGRTWTKFEGNPVLPQITGGNRDPKVIWHDPTKRWVMPLYVERNKKHTIEFFASPNLKQWTYLSAVEGFYECPDLFELPVEGEPSMSKWVLYGASSEYMIGAFDGTKFTPETPKLPGHRGNGFYAAQTYSDAPDDRRIQIGWLRAPSPDMPFNQCMSLPMELSLRNTPDGPRLAWTPAPELAKLRDRSSSADNIRSNHTFEDAGELLEIRAEFASNGGGELRINARGAAIAYDAQKQELTVNGHRAPAPARDGRQRLAIFVDRTTVEVFASDGLTYVPMPFIPKAADKAVSVSVTDDSIQIEKLEVHRLKSAWPSVAGRP
jgi:fructan beta-fructosidase